MGRIEPIPRMRVVLDGIRQQFLATSSKYDTTAFIWRNINPDGSISHYDIDSEWNDTEEEQLAIKKVKELVGEVTLKVGGGGKE